MIKFQQQLVGLAEQISESIYNNNCYRVTPFADVCKKIEKLIEDYQRRNEQNKQSAKSFFTVNIAVNAVDDLLQLIKQEYINFCHSFNSSEVITHSV